MAFMQLYYSQLSPYSRKCRVVAIEKGVYDRIELIETNPRENDPGFLKANPLARIPAMRTDSGLLLCESPVICEYLDSLSPTPALYEDRFCVLALAAMAEGILDAGVACMNEWRKPEDKQHEPWIERKKASISRTIAMIAGAPVAAMPLSIGTITTAVALAYVDFRLPMLGWRQTHEKLAAWHDEFTQRESFQRTKPPAA